MQELDISWQVLRRIAQDWLGTAAEPAEIKPLVGGYINTTLLLALKDGQRAVLKISPHRVSPDIQREADQLKLLGQMGLPVPRVYVSHTASLNHPHSYVLMEFMPGEDLGSVRKKLPAEQYDDLQRQLAQIVLTLHEHTSDAYFRLGEPNTAHHPTWVRFYHAIYDPIWQEVAKSPLLPPRCRKQIGKLHDRLDVLLAHDDIPRLVHWDIWNANLLAAPADNAAWRITALLDPNCKYAHAEAEIAYMELFNTVTPAFMKEYQQTRKLGDGYFRIRRPIYQLYPLLNHIRLFGAEYVKPLLAAVEKIGPLL